MWSFDVLVIKDQPGVWYTIGAIDSWNWSLQARTQRGGALLFQWTDALMTPAIIAINSVSSVLKADYSPKRIHCLLFKNATRSKEQWQSIECICPATSNVYFAVDSWKVEIGYNMNFWHRFALRTDLVLFRYHNSSHCDYYFYWER